MQNVRAITLDLDDTLWPIAPAMRRAEQVLHEWLAKHAPGVSRRFDVAGLRALRERVALDNPADAHDFTRMRLLSIERALAETGHDPALAEPAFAAFFAARNQLALYEEVEEALTSLSARYPLLAITNGNADIHRVGVGHHFQGVVSAREFGVAKPDPRVFAEACRRLGQPADSVLHVGDDWELDVVGARAAGLPAAWLCRDAGLRGLHAADDHTWVIAHLGELLDLLPARED